MAVLPDADRKEVWAELMRDLSNEREHIALTKPDFRAAVDAIDTWLNTNASSLNTAIPQPARANLTTAQKARLLMAIVRKRYVVGA